MTRQLTIIECPRDAMQGITNFIPTGEKVRLLSALLEVGYPVIDFGSFVSPKAIPQMADTAEVLEQLEPKTTKLLAIIANLRGAQAAVSKDKVAILGYPLSISETFQQRNSNKSIVESLEELVEIAELAQVNGKELVVYLSMAFGNPYNDPYSVGMVSEFAGILASIGVKTMAISDTIGLATATEVGNLFTELSRQNPSIEWGLHLHARPDNTKEKLRAALSAGCSRIDGAILGYGGCPMADDDLVGNMPMEKLLSFAQARHIETDINNLAFESAYNKALDTFPMQ